MNLRRENIESGYNYGPKKWNPSHLTSLSCFQLLLFSKSDIEGFRRHLKSLGLSEPSINKAHIMLSRMFSKLKEYQEHGTVHGIDFSKMIIPEKNPCRQVPKVNERSFARKVVVSPDEFKIIRQYADPDLKEILSMFVWTRLRESDLRRLTEKNVNFITMQLEGIQHKTITTKNPSGVPYAIPMTTKMEALIRKKIAQVKPGTPLFSFHNLQKRWKKTRQNSGFLFVQLRDLRRSAASYLLDSGQDEVTVSEGLGHTTTRTTKVYVPRTRKHLKASTEVLTEAF